MTEVFRPPTTCVAEEEAFHRQLWTLDAVVLKELHLPVKPSPDADDSLGVLMAMRELWLSKRVVNCLSQCKDKLGLLHNPYSPHAEEVARELNGKDP